MNEFTKDLIDSVNKNFGYEISAKMEDGSPSDVKIFIPTGSTLLDYLISNRRNGGIPVGKIAEISGLEGTGKTLLAMHICANTQKMGGLPIYIDTENAFQSDFAIRVGLVPDKDFLYAAPGSVEDVFKYIFTVLKRLDDNKGDTGYKFVTIIWDSVAATPCAADLKEENPDPTATVGLKPRILSKNIYTLLQSAGRANVAQVFLNQLRTNIRAQPFSDPYISPGGKAIPFASSVRVRLTSKGKVKSGDQIIGINTRAKCVKTRFGPPHRDCVFPIYFTHGVDDLESIIDLLIDQKKITKKTAGRLGNRFYFKGEKKEDGLSKIDFKKRIRGNPETMNKVLDLLEEAMTTSLINPEEVSIEIVGDDEV